MGTLAWSFLIDENTGRDVCRYLQQYGYQAEAVVDVLAPGAHDMPDVLPYANKHDQVLVTKDIADFSAIQTSQHEGIIFIANHRLLEHEIATGIRKIVDAYPSRDAFRGQREFLSDWI